MAEKTEEDLLLEIKKMHADADAVTKEIEEQRDHAGNSARMAVAHYVMAMIGTLDLGSEELLDILSDRIKERQNVMEIMKKSPALLLTPSKIQEAFSEPN